MKILPYTRSICALAVAALFIYLGLSAKNQAAKLERESVSATGTITQADVRTSSGKSKSKRHWVFVVWGDAPAREEWFGVTKAFHKKHVAPDGAIIDPVVTLRHLPGEADSAIIVGGTSDLSGIEVLGYLVGLLGVLFYFLTRRRLKRRQASLLTLMALSLTSVQCSNAHDLPNGIYLRSVFNGGYLSNTILVFQNGRVAYNPEGDLDQLDFAAQNPKNVGTYSVSGGELTIHWGDGSTQSGPIKPDGAGGFDFGSAPHAPVKPIPNLARLQGTFTGGASLAGISASATYTFDGQGNYSANAAGVAVSYSSASSVTAGNAGDETGTYQISGSRITLVSTAGTRRMSLYYVPLSSGDDNPEMILLGGTVMTK